MIFETVFNDKAFKIDVNAEESTFTTDDTGVTGYTFETLDAGRYLLRIGSRTYTLDSITIDGKKVEFTINGQWVSVTVRSEQDLLLDQLGFDNALSADENQLKAPMPGKIVEILYKEGAEIDKGSPVIILEAMKMENELKAPVSGKIKSINIDEGQSVEKNQLLIEIETIG